MGLHYFIRWLKPNGNEKGRMKYALWPALTDKLKPMQRNKGMIQCHSFFKDAQFIADRL